MKKQLGKTNLDTVDIYSNLGSSLSKLGNCEKT